MDLFKDSHLASVLVLDMAQIRISARQKSRKFALLPAEQDKLNRLTKTFFSFTHFLFIGLWGRDRKLILSKWLPAKPRVPRKDLSEGQGVHMSQVLSPWSCDKQQTTRIHLNITVQKNYQVICCINLRHFCHFDLGSSLTVNLLVFNWSIRSSVRIIN